MRWLAIAVLAPLGCGGGGATPPPSAADLNAIEPTPAMYQAATQSLVAVSDGDAIDLTYPPQGGYVLFVGARVRNLGDKYVRLRGRLRDATTDAIVAEEERTVGMVPAPDDANVLTPDLHSYTNVSNVTVCPSRSTVDLYGKPYVLEVVVTEPSTGRSGAARRTVVPSCRQTDAGMRKLCQCECAANFVIGKCQ